MRTIYFQVNIPKALLTKALRPVWPGIIWSPLSPSRFTTLPEPALPGPRWVRVRNRQCGICATDLTLLLVKADPRASVAALPGVSRSYLGHEALSDVVEVGAGVTSVQVGDRVIMDSRAVGPTCLSQEIAPPCRHCRAGNYAICENQSAGVGPAGTGGGWGDGYTAHESEVYKVPVDLADDQAVLVEPAGVALRTVLRRKPQAGERVLVVGCGIIGLLAVAVARIVAPDAHLTALARYPHQAAAARRLGADHVLSGRDHYEEIARLTGARLYVGALHNKMLLGGYDVIYDAVGSAHTIHDCLRWARGGGTLVVVGIRPTLMTVDLSPVWHQEVTLMGSLGHGIEEWQGGRTHAFDLLVRWMQEGRLPTDGLITHRFPLEEYKRAIATATDKRTGAIKVVLQV